MVSIGHEYSISEFWHRCVIAREREIPGTYSADELKAVNRCVDACVALASVSDHVAATILDPWRLYEQQGNDIDHSDHKAISAHQKSYKQYLLRTRPSSKFWLIVDIADTYKHRVLRNTTRPRFRPLNVREVGGAVSSMPVSAAPISGGFPERMLRWDIVDPESGDVQCSEQPFSRVFQTAKLFWTATVDGEFKRLGLDV